MDSQRPNKYCTLKHFISIIISVLLMTSCTWVKDDVDDCPYGFWLNLHYTYNILDVEAAPEYIDEVSVFVYDSIGNYVSKIDVPQSTLLANNHRVKIEGLPHGVYQFMVWCGTTHNEYSISGAQTNLEEFSLALVNRDVVNKQLPDLYYGFLPKVTYDESYVIHDVDMMKNTNQLACLVVSTSPDVVLEPDDYSMYIVSDNSTMDSSNKLVPYKQTVYDAYANDTVTINDSDYGELHGIRFGLSTLRLMQDNECRLVLTNNEIGDDVFDISFPEYIGMIGSLYTQLGRKLTVQEYLDRQDFYTIVFYMSKDVDKLLQVKVNSWRLRANNHLKL